MRVYNVPASAPFLRTVIGALVDGALVEGFEARSEPARLQDATLYLPTRRACRMARDVFLDVLDTDAVLLPRIVAIGDIDEDELAFDSGDLDLPPPLGALQRRLLLTRLIMAWAEQVRPHQPDAPLLVVTGPLSALGLADSLARLMDDMETRQVPWKRLDTLVPEEVDRYWQLTLDFLNAIVREEWPKVLGLIGAMEPVVRRDELIAREAARLKRHARGPVIAAGSTGSMPATATFLDAVARLPQGAVVLPGLDTELDDDAWSAIARAGPADDERFAPQAAPTHPQFSMQALLTRFGIARSDVISLAPARGRETLLSEAMRPAPTTWQWRSRLAAPETAAGITRALEKLCVVEAVTVEEEALAIAVALRETAETPKRTAALVTPDRALARRVLAACARWNLAVDDSGGDALTDTGAGLFARLAAEAALEGLAPASLLALLKHPLTRLGGKAGGFTTEIATLELALLRGPRPSPGCEGLKRAFAAFAAEMAKLRDRKPSAIHVREPRAKLSASEIAAAQKLVDALCEALAPLANRTTSGAEAFADIAAKHREVVMLLSRDDDGGIAAFTGADGNGLEVAFDDIATQGVTAGLTLPRSEYRDAFTAALNDRTVRRPGLADARLRIYGPLEARLTQSDRVILGGLVEGVWPPQPRADPWLNRGMRGQLGLDLPERRIGLSAHDFAQLMGADEVILTHAAKVGGAPSVASRFLHRLEAVIGEDAWDAAKERGGIYLKLARALDRPSEVRPVRKPEPKPPRELRPLRLSVTEIEHWLRDPYTIYARHILRLAELHAVDTPIGAADRGSAIHGAIGDFAERFPDAMPERPLDELIKLGEANFAQLMEEPEARALWWPRFKRIAQWFVGWDGARRTDIAALKAEMSGKLTIPLGGQRVFTLNARADRIERLTDGRYTIVDFKTGGVPSSKQVVLGISPQLTLEAAMLRAGGFDGLAAGGSVAALTYVKLSGNDPAGLELPMELKRDRSVVTPDETADDALRKLEELVKAFEDESMPYRPLVLSMWRNRYGTYDALARIKEWAASAGAIDEI